MQTGNCQTYRRYSNLLTALASALSSDLATALAAVIQPASSFHTSTLASDFTSATYSFPSLSVAVPSLTYASPRLFNSSLVAFYQS